jgi:hypothetical protein
MVAGGAVGDCVFTQSGKRCTTQVTSDQTRTGKKEAGMEKGLRPGFVLAIALSCMVASAAAQQPVPTPQDLDGTWEIRGIGRISDWGGTSEHNAWSSTATVTYFPGVSDPTTPNLIVDVLGTDDDLIGYAHGDTFAFYKENIDNCGGDPDNFGREIIIGRLSRNGNRISAEGIGFDSNPDCGGTWSYTLVGRKISE